MAEKLKFYDLKTKKSFMSSKWTVKTTKNGRKMAVAVAPSGIKSHRFMKG